mgnify:CR=1 FL=1
MCNWHRPVCVACHVDMCPEKNGVTFIEHANGAPFKIWEADQWKCPNCDISVIVGFGKDAIREHYQAGFSELLEASRKNPWTVEERE